MDLCLLFFEIYIWIFLEKSIFIKNFEVKVVLFICYLVEFEKKKESSCLGYLLSFCMRNKCKVERWMNFFNFINIFLVYLVFYICLFVY